MISGTVEAAVEAAAMAQARARNLSATTKATAAKASSSALVAGELQRRLTAAWGALETAYRHAAKDLLCSLEAADKLHPDLRGGSMSSSVAKATATSAAATTELKQLQVSTSQLPLNTQLPAMNTQLPTSTNTATFKPLAPLPKPEAVVVAEGRAVPVAAGAEELSFFDIPPQFQGGTVSCLAFDLTWAT